MKPAVQRRSRLHTCPPGWTAARLGAGGVRADMQSEFTSYLLARPAGLTAVSGGAPEGDETYRVAERRPRRGAHPVFVATSLGRTAPTPASSR